MESRIKITVLGDICPTNDFQPLFDSNTDALFSDIASLTRDSDFTVCNLECPATDCDQPIIKTGPNLKVSPALIKTLKKTRINAVSLANNHIFDYGEQGVIDTLEILKTEGVCQFGGGRNISEAGQPLVVEIKNKKIGFLSFAEHEFNIATETQAGANLFDPYKSFADISRLKAVCDYVIVLYHGGIEHYKFPSPLLQKKCRAMVDAGADAVFCQHSHCIGTHERYNNSEILYGQGNTIFGYREGSAAWNEGLIAELSIGENGLTVTYRLLEATEKGIHFANSKKKQERLASFEEESLCVTNSAKIADMWQHFCKEREAWYLPMMMGRGRIFNKLNRLTRNLLMRLFVTQKARMTAMNLLRCDAHKEVLDTILKEE